MPVCVVRFGRDDGAFRLASIRFVRVKAGEKSPAFLERIDMENKTENKRGIFREQLERLPSLVKFNMTLAEQRAPVEALRAGSQRTGCDGVKWTHR